MAIVFHPDPQHVSSPVITKHFKQTNLLFREQWCLNEELVVVRHFCSIVFLMFAFLFKSTDR